MHNHKVQSVTVLSCISAIYDATMQQELCSDVKGDGDY